MTVGELLTMLDSYFEQGFSDCSIDVRNEAGDWTELVTADVQTSNDAFLRPVFKFGPQND